MEIVKKWDHTKQEGIYKPSDSVNHFSQIKAITDEMVPWLNENNGHFTEPYKIAYAVSHCQVAADPWAFFVVSDELLLSNRENRPKKDTKINYYFPSQIIVNAKIIEVPERLKVNKPERKVVKDAQGRVSTRIEIKESMEKNLIGVQEACMSFLHRTPKTKERYYRVKVRYQYPKKILGMWFLWRKTEWVEGLKAHIFQHEIDHANGKNMFYDN